MGGHGIAALLQALVEKGKSITVPIQQLDVRQAFVQEDIDSPVQGVLAHFIPHDPGQAIESLAHVDGLAADEIAQVGAQCKHGSKDTDGDASGQFQFYAWMRNLLLQFGRPCHDLDKLTAT